MLFGNFAKCDRSFVVGAVYLSYEQRSSSPLITQQSRLRRHSATMELTAGHSATMEATS